MGLRGDITIPLRPKKCITLLKFFFGPLSRPTDFLSLVLLLSFVQMILLVQELPFPAVSGGVPIIFVVNEIIIKVKVINILDECLRSKVMFQSTNQTLLIGI